MIAMSVKIRNRHRLKRKAKQELQENINSSFDEPVLKEDVTLEQGFLDEVKLIFVDDVASFFIEDEIVFFTVPGLLQLKPNKRKVIVDMGAVRFVTNGADVMSPGIVGADETIEPNQQVWICDQRYQKPLAVGIAMISGVEMVERERGKAVMMKHYIGDKLWSKIQSID